MFQTLKFPVALATVLTATALFAAEKIKVANAYAE